MDRNRFKPSAPGTVVSIAQNDCAFIPNPMPPDWTLPHHLVPLLSQARAKLGYLDGSTQALPNPDLLLSPLQHSEAIASSSIEGTYATPTELILFELDQPEPKSATDPAHDQREVWNYGRALKAGLSSKLPLSLSLLRNLHGILLERVRGTDKKPGEFRNEQVHIGRDRRFNPPPPVHLTGALVDFDKAMQGGPPAPFDPLVYAYLLHYQFETIHPFLDGNGRIGRLLLTLMLHKWCELSRPWLYMSRFFERNKDEYIDRLYAVSAEGKWEEWIEFCLRGTVEQATDTISRCSSLETIRNGYRGVVAKEGTGSVRLMAIIDGLLMTPFVRITDLAKKMDVNYNTARDDIKRLVDLNVLEELPNQKVKTFFSKAIFRVAYDLRAGS